MKPHPKVYGTLFAIKVPNCIFNPEKKSLVGVMWQTKSQKTYPKEGKIRYSFILFLDTTLYSNSKFKMYDIHIQLFINAELLDR